MKAITLKNQWGYILKDVIMQPNFGDDVSKFEVSAGSLVHLTIDSTIKTWTLSSNSYNDLIAGTVYYIYARCNKSSSAGQIILDTTQRKIDDGSTYYYFLIGVLHPVITMKALSLKNPWAGWVYSGQKTIETRTWKTDYRGDILICCSQRFDRKIPKGKYAPECYIKGKAICVVELYDIVKMEMKHEMKAGCFIYPGAYAWLLRNVRRIEPVPVKGQLSLFEVPEGTELIYL